MAARFDVQDSEIRLQKPTLRLLEPSRLCRSVESRSWQGLRNSVLEPKQAFFPENFEPARLGQ